jgi:hypothetical protein
MNNTGSEVSGALASGSSVNVRWEVVNPSTGSGTFNLLIRRGDDDNNTKIILEQWTNLSLDPNQPNYIEAVIGNQTTTTSNGYTQVTGDYTNKSRYVRIKSVALTTPNYFDNLGNPLPSYTSSIPVAANSSFGGGAGTNGAVNGLSNSDYTSSITLLGNVDEFKFNIITTPGVTATTGNSVITSITNMASDRGDCIAIVDMSAFGDNVATVISNATAIDSSYAATYYPWVQISAPNTGKLTWVPPSTIIPSVYAYNDRVGAPWFAPAGFTRGGLKSYIGQVANGLVFEQNTAATRNRFLRQVNPYLDSIQQRQGLYAYKVVMDDSNNTAEVIDRNQLLGQIFIQPTRTAEFIILDFNVTPTGASFD